MQPSIRITLPGGFAVTVNGVDCDVPEAASRLVALLALRPHETFRVEIAAQLWPDRGLVSAVLRLREALSSLRATTSPEIVEGSRSRVRLAPNVTVDARELDALIRRLNADRAVLRAFAEPERLTVELLPGWKDRRIQLKRSELRLRAGYVLGEYIGEQIACGDLPAARRAIDVALDADPLDENAVRALIGIHRSAGDHDEAIRTYFRFRDLWFDTHGLEPTELEALFKWLVTRDPRTLEPRDREREP